MRSGIGDDALAVTGGVTAAAAPRRPAPFRKSRRLESGKLRRLGMASSRKWRESRKNLAQESSRPPAMTQERRAYAPPPPVVCRSREREPSGLDPSGGTHLYALLSAAVIARGRRQLQYGRALTGDQPRDHHDLPLGNSSAS